MITSIYVYIYIYIQIFFINMYIDMCVCIYIDGEDLDALFGIAESILALHSLEHCRWVGLKASNWHRRWAIAFHSPWAYFGSGQTPVGRPIFTRIIYSKICQYWVNVQLSAWWAVPQVRPHAFGDTGAPSQCRRDSAHAGDYLVEICWEKCWVCWVCWVWTI